MPPATAQATTADPAPASAAPIAPFATATDSAAAVTPGTPAPAGAPGPAAALEATIRLVHTHAFNRARLTLKPAELGGVEVVLRGGAGGAGRGRSAGGS